MGILLGWLSLFCFLGLGAKGIARKAGMKRAKMVLSVADLNAAISAARHAD